METNISNKKRKEKNGTRKTVKNQKFQWVEGEGVIWLNIENF